MKQESMDALFHALASTHRRKILDLIRGMPGCNVNDVAKYFDISRIAVMKHLGVLETANLVVSRKNGRARELFVNLGPIQLIYDRWTSEYSRFWSSQAADIKFLAEAEAAKTSPNKKSSRPTKKAKRKRGSNE
ncbi:MAG: helix-turn-helix transcriptional regulator [Candidatus Eisenbacteria bacterium]|uniref:Helix-turn-helix transcriptional regulator n=1 Tax=Eiseniibacteriota bacterium TaxID=2212470 RepID=A0A7Y2E9E8_UNCEI|nr:helix-turn-helix transcriptional regulator [Candidatus Eisenbacteria bacterium]